MATINHDLGTAKPIVGNYNLYIETMQIGIQVSHVPHGCHGHVERQVS